MSWEVQGRQYHQWFGHGTGATEGTDGLVGAVLAGIGAALPGGMGVSWSRYAGRDGLREFGKALPIWAGASGLDAGTFCKRVVGPGLGAGTAAAVQAVGRAVRAGGAAATVRVAAASLGAALASEKAGWRYGLNYARDQAIYYREDRSSALDRHRTGDDQTLDLTSDHSFLLPVQADQPALHFLHSPETYERDKNAGRSLEYHRGQTTEGLIESLKPGKTEPLLAKPDGTVMDGNTRLRVLQERGVAIDALPRTLYLQPSSRGGGSGGGGGLGGGLDIFHPHHPGELPWMEE